MQITQARFLNHILTEVRPEPEYFRIGFYGSSFPSFLRVSFVIVLFSSNFSHSIDSIDLTRFFVFNVHFLVSNQLKKIKDNVLLNL